MSEKKNDGGPAFPLVETHPVMGQRIWSQGLTLRDWFAGQALAGMLANPQHWVDEEKGGTGIFSDNPGDEADEAAKSAFWFADAMIAQRGGEK